MIKRICDICGKPAYEKDIWCCIGWQTSEESEAKGRKEFKPFEKPHLGKKDLCDKCFKKWCQATYMALWKTIPK